MRVVVSAVMMSQLSCTSSTEIARVARVEIEPPTPRFGGMTVGVVLQLTAKAFDESGTERKVLIVWTSSDSSIVSVDQTGLIRSIRTGLATITATATDGSIKHQASLVINVISLV